MYKLVAIGGKLRGTEFPLQEGDNIFGRDDAATVPLKLDGVSKKHMNLIVSKDTVYLEDMGSSNGTFVNGKLVKKIPLNNGDKVALPNVIFQVVHVQEKKVLVKKKVTKSEDTLSDDVQEIPDPPDNGPGKAMHMFKYKVMQVVYEFNKEYEWRSIVAIIMTIYVCIIITVTVFPVLADKKKTILAEITNRGSHYAEDIARMNAVHLSRRNLDSVDTNFLGNEAGVMSYELIDMDGRIVRPVARMNEYTNDTFSIDVKDKFKANNLERSDKNRELGGGLLGVADLIKAHNVKSGTEEPVGIIAIKFAPPILTKESADNSNAYLRGFIISMLAGIFIFGMIYFMTIKHLEDFRYQIESVLRGRQKELNKTYRWTEIAVLYNTVNSLIQKYLEFQNTGKEGAVEQVEEDTKYVEILKSFLAGAGCPAIILNSEKILVNLNPEAEDITGIRESSSSGSSLLDVSRDQGFAATVIELCDQCANSGGIGQTGSYELSGKNFEIHVNTLIGRDNFAKAFYVTFTKDK